MPKPIIHPPDYFYLHSVLLQRLNIRVRKTELSLANTKRITAPSAAVFLASLGYELERKGAIISSIRPGSCDGCEELFDAIRVLLMNPSSPDLFSDLSLTARTFFWESCEQRQLLGIVPRGSLTKSEVPRFIWETLFNEARLRDLEGCHKDLIAYPLIELIKNTIDHTSDPSTFGLSFDRSGRRLTSICYCEVGEGFSVKLRRRLHEIDHNRWDKEDLVGLIRWCITPGNTTRPSSKNNMGLGMGIIIETLERMGINLYMFDASSEIHLNGVATSEPSFRRLREKRQGTHGTVPFVYLGLANDAQM